MLNVQILGLSADIPFSQRTFADSLGLPYPLLSDHPDLRVIRSYGVVQHIGKSKRQFARRSFFLIDKQGIVRGKWLAGNQEVFPSEPILKVAREIDEAS
jgi:peroxiredoxin